MKVFDLHCDTLSELRRAEMRGDGQTFAHKSWRRAITCSSALPPL